MSLLKTVLPQKTIEHYNKLFISLRYYLIGLSQKDESFVIPLKALEYAKKIHIGFRKDGTTPEFQHQIEIAHFARTLLLSTQFPAETIAAALLHDVPEDYDISFDEIESLFGKTVRQSVFLLTKKYRGEKKEMDYYFNEIASCPIASLIKGIDRINNQQSMTGVFSKEKQHAYLTETSCYIIPMLKKARHLHVEQESAYENIKFVLQSQIYLISNMLQESA